VWLRLQRDFANPVIWAAFLCIHHCPFLHTCGIHPQDPQNTWLATTSNDKLGQDEDEIAQPVVEGVHWGGDFHFCVREGVSLLMRHLHQVWDTAQVHWQALAEMSLSAIGISENQPKYWVAIYRDVVEKRRYNPPCHSSLTKTMLAAIYEPSMLLKHPVKYTPAPGSPDLLALSQSTRDQRGVHSPWVSGWVVLHWQVFIPTTSLPSKAL